MKDLAPCPCCSQKSYEECCKPFHEGALPGNALQLMRSRYTAYVLNLPDYIISTTHPGSSNYLENKFSWKRSISKFSQNSTFQKLEILDFKENNSVATVTFTAYLSQEGRDATFTEKSYFEKREGLWLYRGGQLAAGHAPNLVTTGQLRLLPLAYYGDPILRKKADHVIEITDDLRRLVEEMIETMDACDGVGLAAPQIHHSIQLFVIRTPIEEGSERFEKGGVQVFINPLISSSSEETWLETEGCLSIPTFQALVERPKKITLEYTSLDGKRIKKEVSGWEARVIQHEYDHLQGILYIDRLKKEEQAKLAPLLSNLERRLRDGRIL